MPGTGTRFFAWSLPPLLFVRGTPSSHGALEAGQMNQVRM